MFQFISGTIAFLCLFVYFIFSIILDYKDCLNDNLYKRFKIRETRRLIRRLEKQDGSTDEIFRLISSVDLRGEF